MHQSDCRRPQETLLQFLFPCSDYKRCSFINPLIYFACAVIRDEWQVNVLDTSVFCLKHHRYVSSFGNIDPYRLPYSDLAFRRGCNILAIFSHISATQLLIADGILFFQDRSSRNFTLIWVSSSYCLSPSFFSLLFCFRISLFLFSHFFWCCGAFFVHNTYCKSMSSSSTRGEHITAQQHSSTAAHQPCTKQQVKYVPIRARQRKPANKSWRQPASCRAFIELAVLSKRTKTDICVLKIEHLYKLSF